MRIRGHGPQVLRLVEGHQAMELLGRLAGEVGDAGPDDLAERDALDVRHGHEVISVDVAQLVDRQERRAGQAAAALGLAAELGHAGRVAGQRRLEDLEGDELDERLAAQGLPHVPLAAAAEPLQQAVAAQPVAGHQRRSDSRTASGVRPLRRSLRGPRRHPTGNGARIQVDGSTHPRAVDRSRREEPSDRPTPIRPATPRRGAAAPRSWRRS